MGLQDSGIQSIELALKHLHASAETAPEGSSQFVANLARRHKIIVGWNDVSQANPLSPSMYIVQTHGTANQCWLDVVRDIRRYNSIQDEAWKQHSGNSQLDAFGQLLSNCDADLAQFPETQLFEYYRLSRNWLVHGSARSLKLAQDVYDQLDVSHFSLAYSISPNRPEQLAYSDFQLYTRSMKYFSNCINDAWPLQYADIAREMCNHPRAWDYLRDQNADKRIKTFARTYFRLTHGHQDRLEREYVEFVGERKASLKEHIRAK